jgi:selenide,water dikinase
MPTQDLILIGGGHSHAIALQHFGMNPLPGVRLTLITDVAHTPYSGMLPGYVAGLYTYDDCHIDLRPLANFAQARMILDRAIALDLPNNRVICANRPPVAFDLLSIDIGSTPTIAQIPGAAEFATPVKPISKFLSQWDTMVAAVQQAPDQPLRISVVGGGAGGVELSLSIQARLQRILQEAEQPFEQLEMHLFHKGQEILMERSRWVQKRMHQILEQRGIQLHLRETVSQVGASWVKCESGLKVECDRLFWVTQAAATPWLKQSGLATDDRGFVQVNDALQSVSHPQVFAAGDVATMVNHPRPKAGVFAVRQGKPLVENLQRSLQNQSLKSFTPQKEFLILIGLGDERAVASRAAFGFGPSHWIWNWKDAIDRKFMNQFTDLKPMAMTAMSSEPSTQPEPMHCAGCGSKVGSSVLERAIARIQEEFPHVQPPETVLLGLDSPDDAAVLSVPPGKVIVQTVDYFRALIDDPFLFGQIAANHCLSDLFAMGAEPQSALAIATLPYDSDIKQEETLFQLLAGAVKVLQSAGASLVGGHTTKGEDLAFGLTCNGFAAPDQLLRKRGLSPGQVLILTKPLGTGTLFAADMQLRAKGRWIESAIQSMLVSNQQAADIFRQNQVTACTDITGFGLLGHLLEMVRSSQVSVELNLSATPILEGASETVAQGFLSSLHPQNVKAASQMAHVDQVTRHPLFPLLFDPQTSGGLLAAVSEERAIACLNQLRESGYLHSAVVGRVTSSEVGQSPIQIIC